MLATLHPWKTSDRSLNVIEDNSHVGSELAQNGPDNSFRLFKHCDQQMLRFNLLILVSLRQFNCRLDCFLAT